MPRGKLLGGSSGINYLMYVRGSRKVISPSEQFENSVGQQVTSKLTHELGLRWMGIPR